MKKNILLATLTGLLLAAAWPTYGCSLLVFVAFVPLLMAEKAIREQKSWTKLQTFGISYLAFLIWNVITTWWIWYSTEIGAVFAILANSLLMSLTFLLYHIVAKRANTKLSLIFLVTIWLSFEKFHLTWDVSWPWLNLGNVFSENVRWVQWYEFTGTFGGSLWVLTVNIFVFLAVQQLLTHRHEMKPLIRKNLLTAALLLVIPIAASYIIYLCYEEEQKPVNVLVLQPNIDPYSEKYDTSNAEIAQLLLKLSEKHLSRNLNFIITPETVFAQNVQLHQLPQSDEVTLLRLSTAKYPQLNWVVGTAMIDFITDKSKTTAQSNYLPSHRIWFNDYNSAFLLNRNPDIPLYHKSKLVVAVENFPYQNVLKPIVGDALINLGGTVALKTTQPYRTAFQGVETAAKAAPIICYESIYGEFVTGYIKKGANFLAILTNDAWWRNTQGHKQLLSYARLRAIETRRSIARSANTGISAFINQRGDVLKTLAYGEQGALGDTLNLSSRITFYVKMGDYLARVAYFLSFFIFLYAVLRKRETLML